MGVVTIYPRSDQGKSGTDPSEGTDCWDDVNTTSTADYVDMGGYYSYFDLGMQEVTVSASQRIRAVRSYMKYMSIYGGGATAARMSGTGIANGPIVMDSVSGGVTSPREVYGDWKTANPSGSDWTENNVDNLRFLLEMLNASSGRIYCVAFEVDIWDKPVASVLSPSGVVNIEDPTIHFQVVGSSIQSIEVYVYSQAQYSAGGFVPGVSANVTESGSLAGGTTAWGASGFQDGVYRTYVRGASRINGSNWWSDWATMDFTVTLPTEEEPGGGGGGGDPEVDEPPTVTALSPLAGELFESVSDIRLEWTFADNEDAAQTSYEVRYRPTGSVTWVTDSGSTAEFHDIVGNTLEAAEYEWQVRVADSANNWSAWTSSYLFSANRKPAAPPIVQPKSVIVDTALTTTFAWTFTDSDDNDTQSYYELRYRLYQSGSAWTVIDDETADEFVDLPADTFDDDLTYEWQVRVKDSMGALSPFSSVAYFSTQTSSYPIIIEPVSGVGGEMANVKWAWFTQEAYQVRVMTDIAGDPGLPRWDSGTVMSSLTRELLAPFPNHNAYEHVQVRVRQAGLWTEWASVRVYVFHLKPTTPTLEFVAPVDAHGCVVIRARSPEIVDPELNGPTVRMELWRRTEDGQSIRVASDMEIAALPSWAGDEPGEAADFVHVDYFVTHDVRYGYQARAVSQYLAVARSDWSGFDLVLYPGEDQFPGPLQFPGSP